MRTSIAKTGYPDTGMVTMSEMTDNARKIVQQFEGPVFADADDGYDNPVNVARTVWEYSTTGVTGIHIEDVVAPKGAGAIRGKELVAFEEAVGKYRAAVETRDELDDEMLIIGRTDAAAAEDGSLNKVIRRANASYDAGVDLVFIVGQSTEEEVRRIGFEVEAPTAWLGWSESTPTQGYTASSAWSGSSRTRSSSARTSFRTVSTCPRTTAATTRSTRSVQNSASRS